MKKAADAGNDPYLALLEFRNTPSESTGTSPSEKMFGRRQRTILPRVPHPRQAVDTRSMLLKTRERQKHYYDRGSKPLPPLRSGDAIRMRRPGDSDWSLGHCLRAVGNRQYDVEVAGRQYRRNRRDCEQHKRHDPPWTEVKHFPRVSRKQSRTVLSAHFDLTSGHRTCGRRSHYRWTAPELCVTTC